MDVAAQAEEYYRALDEGDYEALSDLLAPEFVQERPDVTLEGRDRFVQFMREERPRTDTRHAVDAVYVRDEDDTRESEPETAAGGSDRFEVAVRGRLLTAEGDPMARFVDVFVASGNGFERLDTYTQ